MASPLVALQEYGQSIWYDNIRRGLITSGELQDLVDNGGVLGVTSNPAIFEKALAGSADYDPAIKALVAQGVGNAKDIYEALAVEDIQLAADVLHPVYQRTQTRDGYLSLEVSPYLAQDTEGTIEEALRLRSAVGRDNVMIKVPATQEGIPAIRKLIAEGVNVNVTLIFSLETYLQVADAYMGGLEERSANGYDLSKVASVASFFISRIDSSIDAELGKALDDSGRAGDRAKLKGLVGKVAIANARAAYSEFEKLCQSDRWKSLAAKGAQSQRVLWASTGTKNPKYSKTLYVDELIGPDTVNTMPTETYQAFKTSGNVTLSLAGESLANEARLCLQNLSEVGISLEETTDRLLDEGLKSFSTAFDKLLAVVEKKRQTLLGEELAQHSYSLGEAEAAVTETVDRWRTQGHVRRLWAGDPALWSGADESSWVGWLHVVEGQRDHGQELRKIVEDVRSADFSHVLLLGMGGSSLGPEVLLRTFGKLAGHPELLVLDSTVPAQIRAVEDRIELSKTLFVVSSKSGGTTETQVLKRYFMDRLSQELGQDQAGSRFIAITDPGTALHRAAKQDGFRHIAHGVPSIGGRYSVLSNFGMVPAALMGIDVEDFLDRTETMVQSCASCVPPEANPGVVLGVALGELALKGHDKLTLVTSPGLASLGGWLEQLIAESTGKRGKGLIPIDGETLGAPEVYGADRVFVYARLNSDSCDAQDASVARLEEAGFPVIRLSIEEAMDLGQAFFRWEIATAVAGAVLGINPFDQPDVEAAKIATREVMAAYEKDGALPELAPLVEEGGLSLYADEKNAEALRAGGPSTVEGLLASHFGRLQSQDYFAINAYLEMSAENHELLQAIRHTIRTTRRVATTLGYGPRFLHSTGQLHKGGPGTGLFLQVTSGDENDVEIPGQRYSFGTLKQAQALGDFRVLCERGRRILRVHLSQPKQGLLALKEMIESEIT